MSKLKDLLRELKHRRVFRMTAIYIVAAWVAVQVPSEVFPAFNIPEGAIRYERDRAFSKGESWELRGSGKAQILVPIRASQAVTMRMIDTDDPQNSRILNDRYWEKQTVVNICVSP